MEFDAQAKTCLLESVIISIKDIKHKTTPILSLHSSYVSYQIKTRPLIKDKASKLFGITESVLVWRRYSDFEALRDYLMSNHLAIIVPPLPEKRVNPTLDGMVTYAWHKLLLEVNEDEEFLERRRKRLEKFLQRIAAHPILCRDASFLDFLTKRTEEDDENDYAEGGSTSKNHIAPPSTEALESPLPPLEERMPSAQNGEISSENYPEMSEKMRCYDERVNSERWRLVEIYVASLKGHLASLLKLRKEMVEKLYLIHKIHGNYGRIFYEWAKSESDLGQDLTKAGKLMTEYALVVDNFVSAEEEWEDNLREYECYADILKGLCKRYQTLLVRYNSLQPVGNTLGNGLASRVEGDTAAIHKNRQKLSSNNGILQPIEGLKTLWGTLSNGNSDPHPCNSREAFVPHNGTINVDEENPSYKEFLEARDALIAFDEEASREIVNFQRQKDREIRTFLKEYAQNQFQLNTKSLGIWLRMKDTFAGN